MAKMGMVITKLSELVDGQEATCFAALVILTLNAVLLLQAFGVAVPALPNG